MSEVRVNNLSNENNTGGPTISGITTYSGSHFFVPPSGDTASRPQSCPPGSLRFNTDSAKLEYYRGNTLGWVDIEAELTEPLGGGTGSNGGIGTRALAFGGGSPTAVNTINFLTITTLGDAQDFGDLNHNESSMAAISDRTRMLCVGGDSSSPNHVNIIEKITISSQGNGSDFGDILNDCTRHPYGGGNSTRGVYGGGGTPSNVNNLEYITIQSEGNGVDFGDLQNAGQYRRGNANSTTRGVVMGLYRAPDGDSHANHNTIEYFTTATLGNAADFGDLTTTGSDMTSTSNCIRAIRLGKWPVNDMIDYVEIATLGNALSFGDLTASTYHSSAATNPTRALRIGGNQPAGATDSIDFMTIMTTGNASDFGDLTYATRGVGANSNGHGGL